jgi:acetyl-CoA C-acetyltransferase
MGRYGGALVSTSPVDLAAQVMRAALDRAGIEGSTLDFYILGNILKHGHGQLLPRQAALKAGIPSSVDGYGLDMLCSSGMMSLMNGVYMIRLGEAAVVLAGGVESMSQTGFYVPYQARYGFGLSALSGPLALKDILLEEGLTDPLTHELMGQQAERLATEYGVTRAELDQVAFLSQQRAAEATRQGYFANEIAPLEIKQSQETVLFRHDEGIRPDTSLESLAKLRPAFAKDGKLTAGNSSQISDGAAALVLASGQAVAELGLKPLARLLGSSWVAGEPWRFAETPIAAIRKLLDRLELRLNDFDLIENNEAFALNNILLHRGLGLAYDRLNVYGGAIALGHPVGCSGARIVVTLLNALAERGGRRGVAALCHGTGGGTAVAVECRPF